ncbi:MAG: LPS export ABC transporter periplasmic protein LptC [Acidobacteriota bacterium]
MPEIKEHSLKEFQLRAKLPQYFRYGAVVLFAITIFIVIAGFYRGRNNSPFKIKGEHTQLSSDVVAEVNGYERLETDGGTSKYYLKADHAKTFSDNHQELQNVYLRTYDAQGSAADTMTGSKALYIPEENKNFTIYMNGDVVINTRDALKVTTNNIVYTKKNETAEADEAMNFERENVRGKSFGATVKMAEKRIELLKDVEIETFDSPELVKSNVRYAKVNAGSASFDQGANKIELKTAVAINIQSKAANGGPKTTDVKADRSVLYLAGDGDSGDTANRQLKRFELFDNVHIATVENGAQPTNIDAGYAIYEKTGDRFELKQGAHILTNANGQPTDIKAAEAVYDQLASKIALSGNAEITQAGDYIKGDAVDVDLFADKKLKNAVVRGNGLVRQSGETRVTTLTAPEINAAWGDSRQMTAANAVGASVARLEPKGESEYSLVTLSAPKAIHMLFKGGGLLASMKTDGRTTIQLDAVGGNSDAANKRITADTVNSFFNDNGKDLRRAEAIGDAELYIEPIKASAENYKTTITAPRFDCDFFPSGNSAKLCIGAKKTKTVRVPTVAVEGHGTQNLLADTLNVAFSEKTKDVERLDAVGEAKFTELQRTAIASEMSFTPSDSVVRLRGGEPTAWDSESRAKAKEIDWDTKKRHSYLRGGVSTTYYSRSTMGDSAPFGSSEKPVFVTSADADFDHNTQVAVYTGNARGWQDNNYVRGDRLIIKQAEGKMFADGNVQSVLYDSKQKIGTKESTVPVYAAARSLAYDRNSRVLQYNGDTDIRQGADRVTAGKADVYLSEKNEVSKTIAENSVVMTQPGRRATGNWVQYTAGDDAAIIRGTPAVVTDAENGSSQAGELTYFMRDHRVVSEGKAKLNGTGRIRNVYKIKPSP